MNNKVAHSIEGMQLISIENDMRICLCLTKQLMLLRIRQEIFFKRLIKSLKYKLQTCAMLLVERKEIGLRPNSSNRISNTKEI